MMPDNIVLTAKTLKNSGGTERYARDVIAGFHRLGLRPTRFARDIDRSLLEARYGSPPNQWTCGGCLESSAIFHFNWKVNWRLHKHRPACVFSINHLTQADLALCNGTQRRSYTNATATIVHSMPMKQELQRFDTIRCGAD